MTSPSVPGSVSILSQEEGLDEQSAGEHHHGGYRDHAGHYRGEEPRWKERPNTVNKFNITGLAFRDVLYLYLSCIIWRVKIISIYNKLWLSMTTKGMFGQFYKVKTIFFLDQQNMESSFQKLLIASKL